VFASSGRAEDIRKGYQRVNIVQILFTMYENGKMSPVETILRMGRGERKKNDGGSEFN
jgi:hypothetical protein